MFENSWKRLVQQSQSRFRPHVLVKTGCKGETNRRHFILPVNVTSLGTPSQNRIQDTVIAEGQYRFVTTRPNKNVVTRHFDDFDAEWLAEQGVPTSETMTEMAAAFHRENDDRIIAAATGTMFEGKDGTDAVALPASQIADVQLGAAGNTGMNIEKILFAAETLAKTESFGMNVEDGAAMGYIALSAKEINDLYRQALAANSQDVLYKEIVDLKSFKTETIAGLKVIRSERLALAAGVRTCFAWVKEGICLDVWRDPKMRVDELETKNYALQLHGTNATGASRLQNEQVVSIPSDTAFGFDGTAL